MMTKKTVSSWLRLEEREIPARKYERCTPDSNSYIAKKLHSITPASIAFWLLDHPDWRGSLEDAIREFIGVDKFLLDDKRIYLAEGAQDVITPPPKWIDIIDDAAGYPENASPKDFLIPIIRHLDANARGE